MCGRGGGEGRGGIGDGSREGWRRRSTGGHNILKTGARSVGIGEAREADSGDRSTESWHYERTREADSGDQSTEGWY